MALRSSKKDRLGWFPQLNPDPRLRISPVGPILDANPASIFLLKDLAFDLEHPELPLPDDYLQRLETMRRVQIGLGTWRCRRGHHCLTWQVYYLPEQDFFMLS